MEGWSGISVRYEIAYNEAGQAGGRKPSGFFELEKVELDAINALFLGKCKEKCLQVFGMCYT